MECLTVRYEVLEYLGIPEMAMLAQTDRSWETTVRSWVCLRHFRIVGSMTGGSLLHQYPKAWGLSAPPSTRQDRIARFWEEMIPGAGADDERDEDRDALPIEWSGEEKLWVIHPGKKRTMSLPYLDIPPYMRTISYFRFLPPYRILKKPLLDRIWSYLFSWCFPLFRDYGEPIPCAMRPPAHEFTWVYADGPTTYLYFEITIQGNLSDDFDDHTVSIGWTDGDAMMTRQPLIIWDSDDGSLHSRESNYDAMGPRFMSGETVGMGYIPSSHEIFLTRDTHFIFQFQAPWPATKTQLHPVIITNSCRPIWFNPGTTPFLFHSTPKN